MTVDRFVRERSDGWGELDALLKAAKTRPERLGPARLRRLGALYRATAADLALARRRWPSEPEVARLESLVGRGRLAVYGRAGRTGNLRSFFLITYWQRLLERRALLGISALFLFGPMLLATLWGMDDPVAAGQVAPGALESIGDPTVTGGDLGLRSDEQAVFSAEVLTNNIQVSFLAFAGGVTAGALTVVVLLVNGVLIGAFTGIAVAAGNGDTFVELVAPHGVLELSCIVVAGAAGLRLGMALIDPGRRTRGRALVEEGRAAAELALGTAPWLVVAGLIEGFVTPRGLGAGPAVMVGLLAGAVYWALVVARGRVVPRDPRARSGPAPSA